MTKINAIIVDDEPLGRDAIRKSLELYCTDVQVVAECCNAQEAKEKVELLNPQLVFLDIAMPGKNGIDFLKELSNINFELIFVTAHNEFILQAIRFSAVDYILKPLDEKALVQAVNRAKEKIASTNRTRNLEILFHNISQKPTGADMQLCIPSTRGFQVIKINDIVYCQAENTYTSICLTDGKQLLSSRSLIEYETLLEELSFVRIHKSWLINLRHMKEYRKGEGGTVIMSDNKELEVSRRKKEHFLELLKQHFKF
jgi:two-component system, LytTR family, response regulator